MKQRIGFVSNSSSSSFIIAGLNNEKGIELSIDQYRSLIEIRCGAEDLAAFDALYNSYKEENEDDYFLYDECDEMDRILRETGYQFFKDTQLFGLSMDSDTGIVEEVTIEDFQSLLNMAQKDLQILGFKIEDINLYWYGVSPGGDY